MIRVAAVADLHCHADCQGRYRRWYAGIEKTADLLVIAGDLTGYGSVNEATELMSELRDIPVPIFAVLGNHDCHSGNDGEIAKVFEEGGMTVLNGQVVKLEVRGQTIGIVGTKGFGGGFGRGLLTPFGEPMIKAWVDEASAEAEKIAEGLRNLNTDYRLVVMHYAPIPETIHGEHPEIFPFLGCSRLAEPIDHYGADLVLHGHAHHGREKGQTATGVPVRNVAMQVLQRYYTLYELRPLTEELAAHPKGR